MKIDSNTIHQQKNEGIQTLNNNDLIEKIINTWTTKSSKNKSLQETIYAHTMQLRDNHNCSLFFITLTLSQDNKSVMEQWKEVAEKIPILLQQIKKNFLAVGSILSIEMQKRTSKTNKRGTDSKAGFPQLHFLLWTTHEILNPSIANLRLTLLSLNFEVKIKEISGFKQITKYFLYTIKEAADTNLINFCRQTLQWNATTLIWICHNECRHYFYQMQKNLENTQQKYTSFVQEEPKNGSIPTTRQVKDSNVLLAQIMHKLFKERNWAVYNKIIYQQYTKVTWTAYMGVKSWITQVSERKDLQLIKTLAYDKILEHNINGDFSMSRKFFPELILERNLMEFKNNVYNFETGQIIDIEQMSYLTSCAHYLNEEYDKLIPPYRTLGLIYSILHEKMEQSPSNAAPDVINDILWERLGLVGALFHSKCILEKGALLESSSNSLLSFKILDQQIIIDVNRMFWKGYLDDESNGEFLNKSYFNTSMAFSILTNSIFFKQSQRSNFRIPHNWLLEKDLGMELYENDTEHWELQSYPPINKIRIYDKIAAINKELVTIGSKCFQDIRERLRLSEREIMKK